MAGPKWVVAARTRALSSPKPLGLLTAQGQVSSLQTPEHLDVGLSPQKRLGPLTCCFSRVPATWGGAVGPPPPSPEHAPHAVTGELGAAVPAHFTDGETGLQCDRFKVPPCTQAVRVCSPERSARQRIPSSILTKGPQLCTLRRPPAKSLSWGCPALEPKPSQLPGPQLRTLGLLLQSSPHPLALLSITGSLDLGVKKNVPSPETLSAQRAPKLSLPTRKAAGGEGSS